MAYSVGAQVRFASSRASNNDCTVRRAKKLVEPYSVCLCPSIVEISFIIPIAILSLSQIESPPVSCCCDEIGQPQDIPRLGFTSLPEIFLTIKQFSALSLRACHARDKVLMLHFISCEASTIHEFIKEGNHGNWPIQSRIWNLLCVGKK